MRTAAGLLLAVVSAMMLNWGFFVQHGASNKLPALSLRHPWTALRLLFTNGRWLLGYVVGLAGWGLTSRRCSSPRYRSYRRLLPVG